MNDLKIFFCSIFACITMHTHAQDKPFQFGVKAGGNLSTAFVNNPSSLKFRAGYHLGLTVNYSLSQSCLIQSGLFFSVKDAKVENMNTNDVTGGTPDWTHTINASYLEIPIRAAYRMSISDKYKLVLGAGPYFGYGLGGKTKQKLNEGIWGDGTTQIEWNTFGNAIYDKNKDWLRGETLKRFDFGADLNVDFEYLRYVLGIGYAMSIINVADKEYHYDMIYRNATIKISLGYKF